MARYFNLISAFFIALCLYACARQGAPTGGPKDVTPPAIDTLASTPNYATRSEPKRLELKFKEWITLSEANAQVVVSPPLLKRPEVLLRGKKVIVKFDEAEKFRENTTYTINFGSAIKDLHEGNPAKDLRFVFSTGDYIDSLRVKGKVVDAFTGDAVENISVTLYDDLSDSVLRKDRPYYFSRTDKTGLFEISNVKSGRFKVAAFEDLDQNLRWDGENERIAFLDSTLVMADSIRPLVLSLFKNESSIIRLGDRNLGAFGVVKLKFNSSADSAVVFSDSIPGLKTLLERTQDSMLVWYDNDPSGAWRLFVNKDTLPIKALDRADFLKRHALRFAADIPLAPPPVRKIRGSEPVAAPVVVAQPVKIIQQNPLRPAIFMFNYPLVSIDKSKWILTSDSLPVTQFMVRIDSLSPRQIRMELGWTPGKSYQLALLPGAVTDFWGQSNADTLRRILTIPTDKQLGGLILRLEGLRTAQAYVVQLLENNTVIEERQFTADKSDHRLTFSKLNVGAYTARVIADSRRNGRWDSGDYWAQRQPEGIFSKTLEPLRANWEVEATLNLNAPKEEKKKPK